MIAITNKTLTIETLLEVYKVLFENQHITGKKTVLSFRHQSSRV
jgi:hypothetical protein